MRCIILTGYLIPVVFENKTQAQLLCTKPNCSLKRLSILFNLKNSELVAAVTYYKFTREL